MQYARVNAITIHNFEFVIDLEGRLVMRLFYERGGERRQNTFAFEADQDIRFATALVKTLKEINRLRDADNS